MFGSNVLEVATGVVFVYVLLSLLCSTINEQVIARFFALRAKTLHDGITNMLVNPQLVQQLYDHPLIKGLSQNAASGKPRKPSYIPADIFARAVVDVVQKNASAANIRVPETLVSLVNKANIDPANELVKIEKWYNDTMDRVSGWYKRKVQVIIFVLGLVIAIGLNIDTISLITSLSNDSALRATFVSAAQGSASTQASTNLAMLQKSIEQIQPAIGWASLPADFWGWILKIVGLLATTFAVALGAPFWFGVLKQFMRSSGPPPQKSTGSAGPTVTTLQLVAPPNTIKSPVVSTDASNGATQ